jgi:hypothetical protein
VNGSSKSSIAKAFQTSEFCWRKNEFPITALNFILYYNTLYIIYNIATLPAVYQITKPYMKMNSATNVYDMS